MFCNKKTRWVQLFLGYKTTMKRQFTFYHYVPRNPWCSFDQLGKDERLCQPWSHAVVLNKGPLDWESSALMTRSLLHKTYSAGSCYNEPFYLILLFVLGYPTRLKQLFLIQQQIPTNTFQLFPA